MPTSTRAAAEAVDCLHDAPALVAGPTDDPTVVVTLGSGERGVVLAPQDGGGPCQWAEQAERLAAEGYHVATFLWVEDGATSIQGAADVLREAGAREVAYVAASKGGAYVAALAGSLDPSPVAVIALSPPRQFGSVVAGPDVGTYTGPCSWSRRRATGTSRPRTRATCPAPGPSGARPTTRERRRTRAQR